MTAAGRNVFARLWFRGSLVTSPGKNISPGGCLVGFLNGWKVYLAEGEPEARNCFCSGSVTKTSGTETEQKQFLASGGTMLYWR
ncbi:hypothetical protein C4J81_12150 [Deltaproteobacteria bacterium Smac51]|nr:hypothetical protein C4J81_12150 [Deltaproteobacteria bacterium Smac51]